MSLPPDRSARGIALQADHVWKAFGSRVVLRDLSFQIECGGVVALFGDNGAGKSTLLRCLAGLSPPTRGRICYWDQYQPTDNVVKQRTTFLAHETSLYEHLTVRENLVFAARMWSLDRPQQRVIQLIEQNGWQDFAERPVQEISTGMAQRVGIARALIHDPQLVLLDEPLSGLDCRGREWFAERLLTLKAAGRTVCLSSHDQEFVRQYVDRCYVLNQGQVQSWDPLKQSRSKGLLRSSAAS